MKGITPAYAGKSWRQLPRSCTVQDHPRLCGEKRRTILVVCRRSGSPPPMRGKAVDSSSQDTYLGITPAYAGKSACNVFLKAFIGDHPRLCGEKAVDELPELLVYGSPPPMRGKDEYGASLDRTQGITPAYAGKR